MCKGDIMFSILLARNGASTPLTWDYYKESGAVYVAPTLEAVQSKVQVLAGTYPVDKIRVVKNCTIAAGVTVTIDGEDVTPGTEGGEG
jgi:hypothetical protein